MYEIFDIPVPEPKVLTLEEFYDSMQSQKYRKHYERLVNRARNRVLEGYSEKHHIIPKCLGGLNIKSNYARLTAEEHFVAHQLLIKAFPKIYKLAFAAQLMTTNPHGTRINNKYYGWLRARVVDSLRNREFTKLHRENMSKVRKGKPVSWEYTEEIRNKIRKSNSKRIVTKETRDKMSLIHSNMSEERKSKIGAASKISRQLEKELGIGMYSKESIAKRAASIKASWDRRKLVAFMEAA